MKRKIKSQPKGPGMLLPGLVKERHKLYEERLAALHRGTVLETPSRVTNASTNGAYDGAELRPFEDRAGSMDAYSLPSLVNGRRVFPRSA